MNLTNPYPFPLITFLSQHTPHKQFLLPYFILVVESCEIRLEIVLIEFSSPIGEYLCLYSVVCMIGLIVLCQGARFVKV